MQRHECFAAFDEFVERHGQNDFAGFAAMSAYKLLRRHAKIRYHVVGVGLACALPGRFHGLSVP